MSDDWRQVSLNPELQRLLQQFTNWRDQLMKEITEANEPREPVFHYTNMEGMRGIISNNKIWYTSIIHLNDPSELHYGIDMARDLLRAQSKGHGQAVEVFCEWMEHVLTEVRDNIFGFFVACFSQDPDDLGQWRAYADNGRGVAIGFKFQYVIDAAKLGITEKTTVGRVIYDPAVCHANLTTVITTAISIITRGEPSLTSAAEHEAFGRSVANELAILILWYALTCKHKAYINEKEIRLMLWGDINQLGPLIETRVRGSNLVPYIPCPLNVSPSAITKIMIGPAADDLAEDAFDTFFAGMGSPWTSLNDLKSPTPLGEFRISATTLCIGL